MNPTTAWWKRPSIYIVLVLIACAAILYRIGDAQGIVALRDLKREFESIGSPPSATAVKSEMHHKDGSAYIQVQYATASDFQSVVEHYSASLKKRGWVYRERKTLPSNTEIVLFCKGDRNYAATVERDLNSASSPHLFWFSMNWHLSDCYRYAQQ